MLEGGELYEQEEAFFKTVESRQESFVGDWIQAVNCTIIKIDGTLPIEKNIEFIIEQIHLTNPNLSNI